MPKPPFLTQDVKLLRRTLDLSQKQMADLLGVSRYSLRALERGFAPPFLQEAVLCALRDQLGLSSEPLLSRALSQQEATAAAQFYHRRLRPPQGR